MVKEDPPAPAPKPRKLTPAEQVQPFLEAIAEAESKDWHRVGLFGHITGATRHRDILGTAFPETWEWKAARDAEGRPAVFVRQAGE